MLVHADVKGLEVVTAGFLSQDPILMGEIWETFRDPTVPDLHTKNQTEFRLPDRVTAKRFTFKMLYGGSAYGFSIDNNFSHIHGSQKFWEGVIERFYDKYKTIHTWHDGLVAEVIRSGKLVMPTGREYHFDRKEVIGRPWYWRPKILNYPVQGLGADLVAIARVSLRKQLLKSGLPALLQSTVHDSIDLDVDGPEETWYNICKMVAKAIEDVPSNFEKLFATPFNLPLTGEVFYGYNLKDLIKYEG